MTSGILLSAGLSSRFGSPKALAQIRTTPAIVFLLEKLINSPLTEIIVVLGAEHQQIEPCLFKHTKIKVVYNKDYKFGQTSSVRAGLKCVSKTTSGFLVLPVDCPFIKATTVESMIARFEKIKPASILIPTHKYHRGHPPTFDICFKDEILALNLSLGINEILRAHPGSIETIELDDPGITQTFNTPDELAQIKKTMGII